MPQPVPQPQVASPSSAGGRRGRPTAKRVVEIDAAIRAAALELFLDAGFEAGNMDAIAARAGVSKGTLYARYESKELLFRAVLEEELQRWSAQAGARDHLLPGELIPRLQYHARTLIAMFDWPRYRRVTQLIDSAILTFPDLAGVWNDIATGHYLRFLARDMAKATDVRAASPADLDFYANVFLHAISGWYQRQFTVRAVSSEEAAAFADRVIETIASFIRKPEG